MKGATMDVEFTDRYDALGIKPPPVILACRAGCEATGVVPVFVNTPLAQENRRRGDAYLNADEQNPRLLALWAQAEAEDPADDGWHFVRCSDCDGSGRQRGHTALIVLRNLPRELMAKARFARFHLFSTQTWRMDVPHPVWFNVRLALRILLTSW